VFPATFKTAFILLLAMSSLASGSEPGTADLLPAPTATVDANLRAATAGKFSAQPGFRAEAIENHWRREWEYSLIPLVASQALDASSSYGLRELNPMLAGGNGTFGPKAVSLKFAAVGLAAGGEYLLVRKSPRMARVFSKFNWAAAALTTGFAVHNFALR